MNNQISNCIPYGPAEQAGIETELVPAYVEENNYSTANKFLLKGLVIGVISIILAGLAVYYLYDQRSKESNK